MDEWTLNDLLECSVCLERLDTSNKVLPCQHTFCKKCLDEIVFTHKELRCPECRIMVCSTVEGLPSNVLLMRILEGMKNAGNPVPKKKASTFQKPPLAQVSPEQGSTNQPFNNIENNKTQPQHLSQNSSQEQNVIPYARAIYDYISKEIGDLSFKKGDLIILYEKADSQWYLGECDGKVGIFPCSYVQVINPIPKQVATCKALYDFRMVNNEDDGCLSFHKDDIITVIRRVDENWAEGKLNDHIGIFPLAFVEMNKVAQALMKLSINQPGPSRIAPPTPTTEESTPLIPSDQTGLVSNNVVSNQINQNTANVFQQNTPITPSAGAPVGVSGTDSTVSSSNSTTSSSSITPNSSSNTSSTSNSAPNSPPSNQEMHNQNPFLPTTQSSRQMILQTSHITNSAHGILPTSHIIGQQFVKGSESFGKPYSYFGPTQAMEFSNFSQHPVEKRHSFSACPASHHNCSNSNKHTAEITGSESAPDNQNGQLIRHGSQRHRRSGSDLTTAVNLPAGYVALYPYKPQKADELELKKGGIYFVTERCQDGWFKGTSSKTQKSGVFPGNYVTPAKPLAAVQGQPRAVPARELTAPISHKPVHQQKSTKMLQMYGRQLAPPELPPRASSPSSRLTRISVQNSSTSWSSQNEFPNSQKNLEDSSSTTTSTTPQIGPSTSTVLSEARTSASAAASPVLSPSVSTPTKSADKVKDKKEKSLIKRLTTMKRSKSPPASASYSMDNPVFDDASVGSTPTHSHPQSVHSRSGSCPSQLIQLRAENGSYQRTISASIPARFKHRERPSVSNANFTHSTSRPMEGTFSKPLASVGSSHRKSNSLDAGDTTRKPRQLIPPVRERFRCIVPYPPNSEYELELRVGDIIYVHKKREDGWYKGTQQRTGRTGLFPASFVETY